MNTGRGPDFAPASPVHRRQYSSHRLRRCHRTARSPSQVAAMQDAGWEIASHGMKWVEHKDMSETEERAAIAEAIALHTEVVGERPLGWVHGAVLGQHRASGRRRRRF